MKTTVMVVIGYDEETDEEIEKEVPCVMEVCDRCEGYGCHLTPSIGQHGYSQEEFYEEFDDEESREQYFKRGGIYDVTCAECKGLRVVPVPNLDALSEEDRVAHEEWCEDERRSRAEDAAERKYFERMGGY